MRRALPIRRTAILALALATAALIAGCESAAEFIPGEEPSTPAISDPDATPAPVLAPPILPPGTVTAGGGTPRTELPAEVIPDAELARSVVQLRLFDTSSGFVVLVRNGSGVVVDATRGLILTSYVLVEPFRSDGTRAYSSIAVGVTRKPGGEPSLEFEAELAADDRDLDLAVLRVTRAYRGAPLGAGEFDLPAVEFGDAGTLEHGDALRLLGHPGIESIRARDSQVVVATAATVTGFRGDAAIEGRAWLKTDARLPWGVSGGPAFDAAGTLVGIATQIEYNPGAMVGQVRSLALATELIESARRLGPGARYRPPLQHPPPSTRQTLTSAEDGITVSAPALAQNAVDGDGVLELFDYTAIFPTRPPALYYEYAAQAIPEGALVEERWYLDGVLQDALSSAFTWSLGPFGLVADRVVAPSPSGIPAGIWLLEVWVNSVLRSSGTAYVAVDLLGQPPGEPRVGAFGFGSLASADDRVLASPSGEATQLLAFFDYEDAGGATQLRWIVFRDGTVQYQSPLLRWDGGDEGTWWVGFSGDGPIGAGFWEFEIYLNGPDQSQPVSRGADGVQLF